MDAATRYAVISVGDADTDVYIDTNIGDDVDVDATKAATGDDVQMSSASTSTPPATSEFFNGQRVKAKMGRLKNEVTCIIIRTNNGHAWVTVDKGHGDKSGKNTWIPMVRLTSLEPPQGKQPPPPLAIVVVEPVVQQPPHEEAASPTAEALAATAAMQERDDAIRAAEAADAKATETAAAEAAAKAAAAAEAAAKLAAAEAAAKKATKAWEDISNVWSDDE